jgi:glyoxylase-like metal-dependent hydrolase (beta-lactamase superfamily II)
MAVRSSEFGVSDDSETDEIRATDRGGFRLGWAGPPRLEKPRAGFYRLKIGKVDIIALSDGASLFDVLGVLAKDKRETAAKIMAKSYVTSPVEASINAYIILLGGRAIPIDAGTGELFGSKLGKLRGSLRAASVTPESITDVLLTHIHPDHSGGLTVGGNKIFPNATIHVNKKELDFWSDKSTREKYPEPTETFFEQVAPTAGPYVTSGQVKTFEGGMQIFPGIRSLPAYGHTPDHTYDALEDGGEKLVFWGDTIHPPDAQFRRSFDHDVRRRSEGGGSPAAEGLRGRPDESLPLCAESYVLPRDRTAPQGERRIPVDSRAKHQRLAKTLARSVARAEQRRSR